MSTDAEIGGISAGAQPEMTLTSLAQMLNATVENLAEDFVPKGFSVFIPTSGCSNRPVPTIN